MTAVKKRKRILVVCLTTAILAMAGLGVSAYRSRHCLDVSVYTLEAPELAAPVRLLHLTDLHNSSFGPENEELLALAAAQFPDLILLTGDLVNGGEAGTDVAAELIAALSELAPVYASLGNHELLHQGNFGVDLAEAYRAAGATVLDGDYLDIEVDGQPIRLGGIYGYCLPEKYLATGEAKQDECNFLHAFQDTDRYTILLCHNPVGWLINGSLDAWEVDCVFAGHTHGGQVVLPLVGGVYGPDLGWFPGRLEGLYHSENGGRTLVLSRGLGSAVEIPRINNVPQIVVVDIVPEES